MNGQTIKTTIGRLQQVAALILVAGFALILIGFAISANKSDFASQFLHSYLFGLIFWVCMTLGCFGFTLLHHVVRGSWGRPALRIWEAGGGPVNLALMAVLFLPVLLGASSLYPWAQPNVVQESHVLQHRQLWMNPTAIGLRTYIFYFGVWAGIAYLLRKWSLDQDKTGDASLAQWRTNLAAGAVVYFFLSVTSAFTDWAMSLDTNWFSTIYGAWFIVGSGLMTLAFTLSLLTRWVQHEPYRTEVHGGVWRDLGNLTLTFTMFWAYTSVSQYLIIWSANLPEEITYYYVRNNPNGPYLYIGTFLIVAQFFVPFLALLSGKTKRDPGWRLKTIAGWILLMRFVDIFWIIMPALYPDSHALTPAVLIGCLGSFLGIGGIWLWVFARQLMSQALIPAHETVQGELSHA